MYRINSMYEAVSTAGVRVCFVDVLSYCRYVPAVQHERAPRCYQYKRDSPDNIRLDEKQAYAPLTDFMDRTR